MLKKAPLIPLIAPVLASTLIISTPSLEAKNSQFVHNLNDFKLHVQLHKARVVVLGMRLARTFFPEVDRRALVRYLLLHDLSKTVDSVEPLKRLNSTLVDLPSQALFSFYGRTDLSESEEKEIRDLVQEINALDHKISQSFFTRFNKLNSETIHKFKTIEKIADLVDRSQDPVAKEEFGRDMIPASEFLQDNIDRAYARYLEKEYTSVTQGMHLGASGSCLRLFQK